MPKRRTAVPLVTAEEQRLLEEFMSDRFLTSDQVLFEDKRWELRNGLSDRERRFILEKLVGLNDKNAALAAGYSVSMAENTKQRIWSDKVRQEFERLKQGLESRIRQKMICNSNQN